MARMRMVKPEFWTSEQIADMSPIARLLFIGLWNFCDDGGIHPAKLKRLKMEVFPGDDFTLEQMQGWIDEIIKAELIFEYEAESQSYWSVTGWKHQKIDKPTIKHPQPNSGSTSRIAGERSPNDLQTIVESSPPEGKVGEGKVKESKGIIEPEKIPPNDDQSNTTNLPATQSNKTPAAPNEKHKPFQWLSWHIHEGRVAIYDDRHYDPWEGKNQKLCKFIMEKLAKDDQEEVIRRLRIFYIKCVENPTSDYWTFTTTNFRTKWDECVGPPVIEWERATKEGKRKAAFAERMARYQEDLENEQS